MPQAPVDVQDLGWMPSWANGGPEPLPLYSLESQRTVEPLIVEIHLNGKMMPMEVDTGAAVSVMNLSSYHRITADGDGDGLQNF